MKNAINLFFFGYFHLLVFLKLPSLFTKVTCLFWESIINLVSDLFQNCEWGQIHILKICQESLQLIIFSKRQIDLNFKVEHA